MTLETPEQLAERFAYAATQPMEGVEVEYRLAMAMSNPELVKRMLPLILARDKALLDEVERRIRKCPIPYRTADVRSHDLKMVSALRSELGK